MEVDFYRGYLSRYCVPLQVEQQGTQLETLQQRNVLLQEENNILKEKIHNLERCRHSQNYTCMQFFADRRKLTSFQTANTDFCVFFAVEGWRMRRQKTKGCLRLSPQRKLASSMFNSSWRRRPESVVSCPDSYNKLWRTHRNRCETLKTLH